MAAKDDLLLLNASVHIEYEVHQINYCLQRLALEPLRETGRESLYNSLLTSYTVYARNLNKFLHVPKAQPDEILAVHYFDDPNLWLSKQPAMTPLLKQAAGQADKRTAHLTYDRVTLPNYWWKWIDIQNDIRKTLKIFVALVPRYRIIDKLRDFESEWKWTDSLPPPPSAP